MLATASVGVSVAWACTPEFKTGPEPGSSSSPRAFSSKGASSPSRSAPQRTGSVGGGGSQGVTGARGGGVPTAPTGQATGSSAAAQGGQRASTTSRRGASARAASKRASAAPERRADRRSKRASERSASGDVWSAVRAGSAPAAATPLARNAPEAGGGSEFAIGAGLLGFGVVALLGALASAQLRRRRAHL